MKKFIQDDVSKFLDHEGVTSNKEIGFQVQAPELAQTIMKQGGPETLCTAQTYLNLDHNNGSQMLG